MNVAANVGESSRAGRPAISESANLEIHISRSGVEQYSRQLRFTPAGNDADTWHAGTKLVQFTRQSGTDAEISPKEVGGRITAELLSDDAIATGFASTLAIVNDRGEHLHVRLFIDPNAAELQVLPWETMLEPGTDRFLFAGERRSFSRFLAGADFSRIELRSEPPASAAIIIANPRSAKVAPFDLAAYLGPARRTLGGLRLTEHASPGDATLARIVQAVREGNDIIYLVAHGSMAKDLAAHGSLAKDEPFLWLEDGQGGLDRIPSEKLVEAIDGLRKRPRLFVLLSCRSGGDDVAFQAALGPRLAAIGVPAVVAMRGDVPLDSAAEFLGGFFRELQSHGSLDKAVSVARSEVRDKGSAWMPVLYSRMRSGRLWYRPGFVRTEGDAGLSEKWGLLMRRIHDGTCTPILGPQLSEPLIGSFRDIALQWSSRFAYPLAPQDREKLTSVAQYVATNQDRNALQVLFADYVRESIRKNFPALGVDPDGPVGELLNAAWEVSSRDNPDEPHRALASLPFPIYLTTNTNLLLEQALADAGRQPASELYGWNSDFGDHQSVFAAGSTYRPSRQSPLVFHLFGHMNEPNSGPLLTEDDYFDYLIKSAKNRDQLPAPVKASLYNRSLLFLGFQIDDWGFRVLFRSLTNHENFLNLRNFSHIAVQVDPEEGRILEPGRARRFLETYFKQIGNIDIFWGSTEEFTRELSRQWKAAERPRAAS